MKQRVAIARALETAEHPADDEPLGALDAHDADENAVVS